MQGKVTQKYLFFVSAHISRGSQEIFVRDQHIIPCNLSIQYFLIVGPVSFQNIIYILWSCKLLVNNFACIFKTCIWFYRHVSLTLLIYRNHIH